MKTKNSRKKGKSDLIYAKKSKTIEKAVNPFEVHKNREKFTVLNRKQNHGIGLPLKAKQKALEKRKESLGAEYNLKHKNNVYDDKRKANFHKVPKESIYNLNDTEVLTHRGQTLAEIENFDDNIAEEDLSDEEFRLDAKFTEAANFGGGSTSDKRDRKNVIEELIADSKKRKVERIKEFEEVLDMTHKLDAEWKELIPVVNKLHRTETPDKPEQDDYDRLVKEMIFAPRGEPTEKLKSEQEIARNEKQKLDKLERERLKRMKGESDDIDNEKAVMRSADDLDDGYYLEPVVDDGKVLSYPIEENDSGNEQQQEEEEEREIEPDTNQNDGESESEESQEESASESEEENDSLEDLKNDDSESDQEQETTEGESSIQKTNENENSPNKNDDIPFIIAFPESYESFISLLENKSIKAQCTIIDRIIKTNHPKLHSSHKKEMLKLFAFLLQYINDLFSSCDESNVEKHFKFLHFIGPHLYDLIQMNVDECSQSFVEVVKEKYEDYQKNTRTYPKLDTLIFFKVLGILFSTSDFRHPVVTPCFIFMHHILSQAKIKSSSDIASGLFLVSLMHDYQQLSKRFLPSTLNFLNGIIYSGIKIKSNDNLKAIAPFKKLDETLVLNESCDGDEENCQLKSSDFIRIENDTNFKVRALSVATSLIKDYVALYSDHVGVKYIADSYRNLLLRLHEMNLPQKLKASIQGLLDILESISINTKFKYPVPERKSIPMLRMLEPRFETVLSDRRQMNCQVKGPKAERKKLQHMLKREMKGAKREMRRDNEFISKIKFKRRAQMDAERKEKVKRIFNEASLQQSEYKALSRTKGRKGLF